MIQVYKLLINIFLITQNFITKNIVTINYTLADYNEQYKFNSLFRITILPAGSDLGGERYRGLHIRGF